jgi:hypothetical protein
LGIFVGSIFSTSPLAMNARITSSLGKTTSNPERPPSSRALSVSEDSK